MSTLGQTLVGTIFHILQKRLSFKELASCRSNDNSNLTTFIEIYCGDYCKCFILVMSVKQKTSSLPNLQTTSL